MYKLRDGPGARFADLISDLADLTPEIRYRFTSPHPKDFPIPVLHAIRDHRNICKQIHLPAQSGSDRILKMMRRFYTKESYLDLV
jgi:tRNA A37 methylthiotransferase MiaB